MILLIVSFQTVLVASFLLADKAFNMFPASVDHSREMLSVLTNLDDASGGMVCGWI